MTNYCTLFDSNYLTRGLALYESLRDHTENFHLYIYAFDDKCFEVLKILNLPFTTIISLKDFEDPQLLAVKPGRNRAEYYWTCSSSIILYSINKFKLDSCTFLDSDLYFFGDPRILINEMGDKSISVMEHRYTLENDRMERSGRFCVQFMTFKADQLGLSALKWWRERCIEWCFERYEDGKMGDQKYLDDWPTRFSGVHILQNLGGGMAPWNIQQYAVKTTTPLSFYEMTTGQEFKPIFYHFHQTRLYHHGQADLGGYRLSRPVIDELYRPYLRILKKWDRTLQNKPFNLDHPSEFSPPAWQWRQPLQKLKRKLKGVYNVFPTQSLID